jgi:ribosomal protein L29
MGVAMKIKELVQKDDKALINLLTETKAKLVKDHFKIASREMTNVSEIKKAKRLIAQVRTILREREIIKEEARLKKARDKKSGDK